MTASDIILRLIIGAIIGFIIGLTSIGAGALVLPTLTLALGMPTTTAIGTASLYSFLTKIFASVRHFQLKSIEFRVSGYFLVGAIPSNSVISWFISRHAVQLHPNKDAIDSFQDRLMLLIALVVIFCSLSLILQAKRKIKTHSSFLSSIKPNTFLYFISIIFLGALVGAIMGATGIGGGVLIVPILIVGVSLSPAKTVGTSVFIALFLSLITAFFYGSSKQIDLLTAIIMTIGGWIGVFFGSRLTTRTPDQTLIVTIASVVFLSALIMLIKVFV